jgi:hypothetical protein
MNRNATAKDAPSQQQQHMNFMFERANDFLNLLHPDSCVSRRQPYFAVAAELYRTRVQIWRAAWKRKHIHTRSSLGRLPGC